MNRAEGDQTASARKPYSKQASTHVLNLPSFLLLWFPLPCVSVMSLNEKRKRTISPFSFFMGTMSNRHQKATPEEGEKVKLHIWTIDYTFLKRPHHKVNIDTFRGKHHILKTLSFPSMLIILPKQHAATKNNVAHLLKLHVCDLKEKISQVKELSFLPLMGWFYVRVSAYSKESFFI